MFQVIKNSPEVAIKSHVQEGVVNCRKAALVAPPLEALVSLGVPVNEALAPVRVALMPPVAVVIAVLELEFRRAPWTARVMGSRTGVAVPALRGAGVLGVKSGMLLQFWFCRQYAWEASYCQLERYGSL